MVFKNTQIFVVTSYNQKGFDYAWAVDAVIHLAYGRYLKYLDTLPKKKIIKRSCMRAFKEDFFVFGQISVHLPAHA